MRPVATTLTVFGGGKMGEALVGGLVEAKWCSPAAIAVVEPSPTRREELVKLHEGLQVLAGVENLDPELMEDVLIAVKPNHCREVALTVAPLNPTRVLSIAAGVTTASLETWLPQGTPVVRAMPNTPSLIGCGMAAIAGGSSADPGDLSWASGILASVGEVITLDESAIDAVTGVSGSGPAYVFLLAEALIEAGEAVGLERATAETLALQTLLGSARLLAESGQAPDQLRANVTSPGGTTAAGLAVFENADLRGTVRSAVEAATKRSSELGAQ